MLHNARCPHAVPPAATLAATQSNWVNVQWNPLRKTILKTTHSGLKRGVFHGKAFISGLTGKQDGKGARKNSGPKKRGGLWSPLLLYHTSPWRELVNRQTCHYPRDYQRLWLWEPLVSTSRLQLQVSSSRLQPSCHLEVLDARTVDGTSYRITGRSPCSRGIGSSTSPCQEIASCSIHGGKSSCYVAYMQLTIWCHKMIMLCTNVAYCIQVNVTTTWCHENEIMLHSLLYTTTWCQEIMLCGILYTTTCTWCQEIVLCSIVYKVLHGVDLPIITFITMST